MATNLLCLEKEKRREEQTTLRLFASSGTKTNNTFFYIMRIWQCSLTIYRLCMDGTHFRIFCSIWCLGKRRTAKKKKLYSCSIFTPYPSRKLNYHHTDKCNLNFGLFSILLCNMPLAMITYDKRISRYIILYSYTYILMEW